MHAISDILQKSYNPLFFLNYEMKQMGEQISVQNGWVILSFYHSLLIARFAFFLGHDHSVNTACLLIRSQESFLCGFSQLGYQLKILRVYL